MKKENCTFSQRLRARARARFGGRGSAKLMEACLNTEIEDLRLNVKPEAIRAWWYGKNIPRLAEAAKLCRILDCSLDYLMGLMPELSLEEKTAAEYIGLSLASVDALRAFSEDQRAALDKILSGDPAKLLAAVSAAADAIQETSRAAALVSQAEKDLDAVHHGQQRAEDLLREDLAELRLLQHTQPLKTQQAGRALEALLKAVAPPVSVPARILDDEAAQVFIPMV